MKNLTFCAVLQPWSRNLAYIRLDIKCSLQSIYIFGGITCFFTNFSSHRIVLFVLYHTNLFPGNRGHMNHFNQILNKIKSVEKLNKIFGATNSTELGLSYEFNKGNKVKIDSDEHLIFTSQKNNFQMKITKRLIPSNQAYNQHAEYGVLFVLLHLFMKNKLNIFGASILKSSFDFKIELPFRNTASILIWSFDFEMGL